MYSRENYRRLLSTAIEANYEFCDFTSITKPGEKHIYLRHDVDLSPTAALQLARENRALKVSGTFFFSFRSSNYNLVASPISEKVHMIHSLGQKIGFMYDALSTHNDKQKPFTAVVEDFEAFVRIIPEAQPVFTCRNASEALIHWLSDHSIPEMTHIHDPQFRRLPTCVDTEAKFSISNLLSCVEKQFPDLVFALHPDFWIAGGQTSSKLSENIQPFVLHDMGLDPIDPTSLYDLENPLS
ncbi:MAG: hypothetical protein ABI690_34065 [Chloroflexota bacterium]